LLIINYLIILAKIIVILSIASHDNYRHLQTQPMCYTGTTRVCVQNFAAVLCAVSEEIASTFLRRLSTLCLRKKRANFETVYHDRVYLTICQRIVCTAGAKSLDPFKSTQVLWIHPDNTGLRQEQVTVSRPLSYEKRV